MRRIALITASYQQALATTQQSKSNPSLEVAAVSFQHHHGQQLGVIVTPWFMGLLLLPVEIEGWRDNQTGDAHKETFPAGDFEFTHGWDSKFGAFGSYPLFPSMDEFTDQAAALQMAERVMQQLFVEAKPKPETVAQKKSATSKATIKVNSISEAIDTKRRGLLTGSFLNRK
ncbi:MAG: [NiFe]-hydrogenase assembly chaperone HybE [Halopseudomonas sp.]